MTARLPTVAGDSNAWGSILNDFLSVSHASDGTLANRPVNLKDYCVIDGATDDSAGFTTAYTLAASLGVGLYMPGGTLVKGNDTLRANVPIDLGGGTIKLKNGANADLFSAQTGLINLAAANGTSGAGTLSSFSIRNGTLDGNKANQTGGPSWCLRFYGYDYKLSNLYVKNGFSGGILSDWNGGGTALAPNSMESQWTNVKVHGCNGVNIQFGGPHDTQWNNVISYISGTHCLHIAPNASGMQLHNCHFYGAGSGNSSVAGLIETGYVQLSNCAFESVDFYCLVLLTQSNQLSNIHCFASTGGGLKLGQDSGETPIPGQIMQSGGFTTYSAATDNLIGINFDSCTGAAGCIKFPTGGAAINNIITGHVFQSSGAVYSGYADPTNDMRITQSGITPDGTTQKGGIQQFNSKANVGYTVSDGNYTDAFNVNPRTNRRIELPNGAYIQPYTDAYATLTSALRFGSGAPGAGLGANGDFYYRVDTPGTAYQQLYLKIAGAWVPFIGAPIQSATTPDPGAGGTITTAGVTVARVTPAASRTGVILQAGTVAGQKCTVINNSGSFTITFAASGTSHVADGVSDVIAVNGAASYTWDSVAALWYKG